MEMANNHSITTLIPSFPGRDEWGVKQAILNKTHYGLNIYAHILQFYYPDQILLSISGKSCVPARNPFNDGKRTLNIHVTDKWLAAHTDSENAIPDGDVFSFAELHYKQSGDDLLQTINKEMCLHIGEKSGFYANRNKAKQLPVEVVAPVVPSKNQNSLFPSPQEENTRNRIEVGEGTRVRTFSFFKAPISNTKPHKTVTLLQVYNAIKGDYYKLRTEELRAMLSPHSLGEGSEEMYRQARQYKARNFDYCTFSGVFSTRSDKAIIKHSGLLCVDFDHLNSSSFLRSELVELRGALLTDNYFDTQLLFVSPSGDGLKWIISIDISQTSHGRYFAAVANYIRQTYGVEVDKSGRDISRACFLPHDPNAYINPLILQ